LDKNFKKPKIWTFEKKFLNRK